MERSQQHIEGPYEDVARDSYSGIVLNALLHHRVNG